MTPTKAVVELIVLVIRSFDKYCIRGSLTVEIRFDGLLQIVGKLASFSSREVHDAAGLECTYSIVERRIAFQPVDKFLCVAIAYFVIIVPICLHKSVDHAGADEK